MLGKHFSTTELEPKPLLEKESSAFQAGLKKCYIDEDGLELLILLLLPTKY